MADDYQQTPVKTVARSGGGGGGRGEGERGSRV